MSHFFRFARKFGYDNWECSNGFLSRWKHTFGVVSKAISGKSAEAADPGPYMREILPPLLAKYHPRDIYNADETAFYYKVLPHRTHAFKHDKVAGGVKSKDRLTLFLITNMDGSDKMTPIVIGKAAKPHHLKRVYGITPNQMSVWYYSQANSWMTQVIYEKILDRINCKLAKQLRKILLIVDNCAAHSFKKYSNIQIEFLPPNVTSKIQPLDQGIIRAVKCRCVFLCCFDRFDHLCKALETQ